MDGETQDRASDALAAGQARWLVDCADIGWLTGDGAALGGPVEMATDADGTPVFALPAESMPAQPGQLDAATLLVTEAAMGGLVPRDTARLTMLGRARVLAGDATAAIRTLRRRAAEVHGGDVVLFRLEVATVRYKPRVGSRAREATLSAADWRAALPGRTPRDLAALVTHLNDEHGPVLRELLCPGRPPDGEATVVIAAVRPHRLELTALTADGVSATSLGFRRPVGTPADLAAELLSRLGRVGWGHCTRTLRRCPERQPPQ